MSTYFPRSSSSLILSTRIGVSLGLHPSMPLSFRRSNTYFLWEIEIPFLDRKYFISTRSLIWNPRLIYLGLGPPWAWGAQSPTSPVSSTYTNNTVSFVPLSLKLFKEGHYWPCVNFSFLGKSLKQALGDAPIPKTNSAYLVYYLGKREYIPLLSTLSSEASLGLDYSYSST